MVQTILKRVEYLGFKFKSLNQLNRFQWGGWYLFLSPEINRRNSPCAFFLFLYSFLLRCKEEEREENQSVRRFG
jgi:hypothetical protein